jgi:hypothetical protein
LGTVLGIILIVVMAGYAVRVGGRARAAGAGSWAGTRRAVTAVRNGGARAAVSDGIRRGRRQGAAGAAAIGTWYGGRVAARANREGPGVPGRLWHRLLTGADGILPAEITGSPPDGGGMADLRPPTDIRTRRPQHRAAEPPEPPAVNGRNQAVASTTGSAEKLIEGVNQVAAESGAGNIHAKHAAIKACTEGLLRFAAMLSMMSRALSEPGMNYGPEITEPLAKGAVHLQAAAMATSESDAALTTLIAMSVGDLANSARQAPHHAELTESGTR